MNEVELRVEMVRHGDNYTTLAKALGKNIATLSSKIHGRLKFSQQEMQTIIDRYELSPERIKTIFFTPKVSKIET